MSGLVDVETLAAGLAPGAQLAGLDLGSRTIGVALSDGLRMTATPMTVLKRGKFGVNAAQLEALVADRLLGGWVIGLPLNMDGTEGPAAQSARAFARNLARINPAPILMWDERLSTVAAERAMIAADASRRRRAETIDQVAAALILQGALDRIAVLTREAEA